MTITFPYPPMDAKLVAEIPAGPGWQYEPKWDGFRCVAFKKDGAIVLQSKSGQRLERYFPELVDALQAMRAPQFVLDGEIVVPEGSSVSFDELLQRIHPAQSRVERLAREHPALFIMFDLLVDAAGRDLTGRPLHARRTQLERFAEMYAPPDKSHVRLSPATTDRTVAERWLTLPGGALDGIIAKAVDLGYRSGERDGMQKVKRLRTADCVVGGFRYASAGKLVGSLLLGLHDDEGLLNHVGFTSGFQSQDRAALTRRLESLVAPPGFTGRAPGGPSRWSTERSGEWQPLKPSLVAEVRYDHFTGGRFRHGTKFLRWRPDKAPSQCLLAQVEVEGRTSTMKLLSSVTARSPARGTRARKSGADVETTRTSTGASSSKTRATTTSKTAQGPGKPAKRSGKPAQHSGKPTRRSGR